MGAYDTFHVPVEWWVNGTLYCEHNARCTAWAVQIQAKFRSFPGADFTLGDKLEEDDYALEVEYDYDGYGCGHRTWNYWFKLIISEGVWIRVEQLDSCPTCHGFGRLNRPSHEEQSSEADGPCTSCSSAGHSSKIVWKQEAPPPFGPLDGKTPSEKAEDLAWFCERYEVTRQVVEEASRLSSPELWRNTRKRVGLGLSLAATRRLTLLLYAAGDTSLAADLQGNFTSHDPLGHGHTADQRMCHRCRNILWLSANQLLQKSSHSDTWSHLASVASTHPDNKTRSFLLVLLSERSALVPQATYLAFLAERCRDRSGSVNARAITLLAQRKNAEDIPTFRALLSETDQYVQGVAIQVLVEAKSVESVDDIVPLLESPNPHVSNQAVMALGALGRREHLAMLRVYSNSPVSSISESARAALRDLLKRVAMPSSASNALRAHLLKTSEEKYHEVRAQRDYNGDRRLVSKGILAARQVIEEIPADTDLQLYLTVLHEAVLRKGDSLQFDSEDPDHWGFGGLNTIKQIIAGELNKLPPSVPPAPQVNN